MDASTKTEIFLVKSTKKTMTICDFCHVLDPMEEDEYIMKQNFLAKESF
jgi:hypothetical protein